MLIGLQLPVIVDGVRESGVALGQAFGYAALACLAVVLTRLAWTFGITAMIRALDRRPSQLERRATWQARLVGSWAGMRGAVSLAAALALPLTTDAGDPLPGRSLILFITFAVILFTLVGQGLTLPWLIRALGVHESGDEEEHEEVRARLLTPTAALERLEQLQGEEWTNPDTVDRVRALYEFRRRRFEARAGKVDDDGIEDRSRSYQRLMREIHTAQRLALVGVRNRGEASVDVLRRLERELDLEEARLEV